ncbi:MAG: hypothetical protein H6737_20920 [Alphaproteobacteria bacterium]|nr:hypothetical protein [Alphaproteobacteria bacterium]
MTASPPSFRAWLRAGLISLALVVHGIYALPSPVAVDDADLNSGEGREEVRRWVEMLNGIGIALTAEELGELVKTWSTRGANVHNAMKRPFRTWMRQTGTGQGWGLFASPDTYPHRLEIYVFEGNDWVPIFRRNDPELRFLDGPLRYRRVRGIYDGSTGRQRVVYWNFSRWVARRALLAHPEASRVRVQMVGTHTTLPWEKPDPTEVVRAKRVFTREALFPDDGLAVP